MKKLLFAFLLISSACFGQSKKEQIELLKGTIDSLNTVVQTERDNSAKAIYSLNDKIEGLNEKIGAQELTITKLIEENSKLSKNLSLQEMANKDFKQKIDSLTNNATLIHNIFEFDSNSQNLINHLHLIYSNNWLLVDEHYFDHIGGKLYRMKDGEFTLIVQYGGESGSDGSEYFLLHRDELVLNLGTQSICTDYVDGSYSKTDFTEYYIRYWNDQKLVMSVTEKKHESCSLVGAKYKTLYNDQPSYLSIQKRAYDTRAFITDKVEY